MRLLLVSISLAVASPLTAQAIPMTPRPSALFVLPAAAVPAPDTLPRVDTGLTKWQGGGIGVIGGALLGAASVALFATGDQCEDCGTSGENKPYGTAIAIGALLGMIVGTQ